MCCVSSEAPGTGSGAHCHAVTQSVFSLVCSHHNDERLSDWMWLYTPLPI